MRMRSNNYARQFTILKLSSFHFFKAKRIKQISTQQGILEKKTQTSEF